MQELDAGREPPRRLRTGQVALFAEPGTDGVVYHYDDTNPQARTARLLADTGDPARGGPRRSGRARR